jgi:hypothetical protein
MGRIIKDEKDSFHWHPPEDLPESRTRLEEHSAPLNRRDKHLGFDRPRMHSDRRQEKFESVRSRKRLQPRDSRGRFRSIR